MKKALITGITGQDGSYLAELLLNKDYEVHGLVRKTALEHPDYESGNISHIRDKLILHTGDLENYSGLLEIINKINPDECYHLGAQSFVHKSFDNPFPTFDTNIWGTLNIISALKEKASGCKIYFAGSSEMFGKVKETPQKEETRFHPKSPYGITKVTGFDIVRNYRETYNMFACTGILFNHESPRRGHKFVTRKITRTVADIEKGKTNTLILGNLDSKRDWGFAGDYVEAMWLMLQREGPRDYVIGTGEAHSVRDFVDKAFEAVDLGYEIVDMHEMPNEEADKRIDELRKVKNKNFVIQHPMFYRPAEENLLLADPSKIKKELGWKPKVKFGKLVKMMVQEDLK